jgi:hypothetical protein
MHSRARLEIAAAERIAEGALLERRVAAQLKRDQAAHEAATGFALCLAISCLDLAVFPRPEEGRKCESSLFSVRLARSSNEISTKNCAQERDSCHVLSRLFLKKSLLQAVDSGQQIIAAASDNRPPDELADWGFFRQNDARIDIRSIGFAPRDMRLIH